jgi:hypothetical protein
MLDSADYMALYCMPALNELYSGRSQLEQQISAICAAVWAQRQREHERSERQRWQ